MGALADDPRPPQSRKISGAEKYRLRCGVYRILYEIHDNVLLVLQAAVTLGKLGRMKAVGRQAHDAAR